MAVLNVKEKWSEDTTGVDDKTQSVRRVQTVLTDTADTAEFVVLAHPDVKTWGDQYSDDYPFLRVRRVNVKRITPYYLEVTQDYTAEGRDGSVNPVDVAPDVSFRTESHEETWDHDLDGRPYENSARMRFADGIPITRSIIIMQVSRLLSNVDVPFLMSAREKVNSDSFFSAPGQALIRTVTADDEKHGDVLYWRFQWEIAFRQGVPADAQGGTGGPARAWWHRVIDAGVAEWYQTDASTGRPIWRSIKDDDGQPISSPVALNGLGQILRAADPYRYREFRRFDSVPFAPFGIL